MNDEFEGYDDWKLQGPPDNGAEAAFEECEAIVDDMLGRLAQVIDASNLDMTAMEVVQEYWDARQAYEKRQKERANG